MLIWHITKNINKICIIVIYDVIYYVKPKGTTIINVFFMKQIIWSL